MARTIFTIQDGEKKRPPFNVTKKAYEVTYREKGYDILDEADGGGEVDEISNQRPGDFAGTFDPDTRTPASKDVSAKAIAAELGIGEKSDEDKTDLTAPNTDLTATGKSKNATKAPTPPKPKGKSATRPKGRAADSGQNRPAKAVTATNESKTENKSTATSGTTGSNPAGAGDGGGAAGTSN